jgi:simple sugar transport system ATP-binding protein
MAGGRVSPSVPTAEATVERVGEWMSGLWSARAQAGHAEA